MMYTDYENNQIDAEYPYDVMVYHENPDLNFNKEKEILDSSSGIKHIDPVEHKKLTGRPNDNILDMLTYLSDIKKPIWIRHVLVPTITDIDEYLYKTKAFIDTLSNVERVDVLPYHELGIYKWKELGIPYQLDGIKPPSRERLENAQKILQK